MATSIAARVATLDELFKRINGNKFSQQIAEQAGKYVNSVRDMLEVYNSPSRVQPVAAHIVRLGNAANKVASDIEKINAQVAAIFAKGMVDINERKMAKVPLVPDQYAAELRERGRGMSAGALGELLTSFAAENKASLLAAFTEVPAALTGISTADQSRFRDMILEIHAPQELAEERELWASYDAAIAAYKVAKATAGDYSNERSIAAILNAEQRAVKADAAMARSIDAGA